MRVKRNMKETSEYLLNTIYNVEQIVEAYASGRLPAPILRERKTDIDVRTAPSFVRKRYRRPTAGVKYTSDNIADALLELANVNVRVKKNSNRMDVSVYVKVALACLEGCELGVFNRKFLQENLEAGKVKLIPLWTEIKTRMQAFKEARDTRRAYSIARKALESATVNPQESLPQ